MKVEKVPENEARKGYEVRDQIAKLLGGRPFFLVAGDRTKGDVLSNIKDKDDAIWLLEAVLRQLRAVDFEHGVAVEVTGP